MLSEILFETDGGTPFDAMQRYDPISLREIFVNLSTSPRKVTTETKRKFLLIESLNKNFSFVFFFFFVEFYLI